MARIDSLTVEEQNELLLETLQSVRTDILCLPCVDEFQDTLDLIEDVIGPEAE